MDNPYLILVLFSLFSILLLASLVASVFEAIREHIVWPIISSVLEIIVWVALGVTLFKGMI